MLKHYLALTFTTASLFGQTYYVTNLGVLPGYQASLATGINKQGMVVGYSFNSQAADTRARSIAARTRSGAHRAG